MASVFTVKVWKDGISIRATVMRVYNSSTLNGNAASVDTMHVHTMHVHTSLRAKEEIGL